MDEKCIPGIIMITKTLKNFYFIFFSKIGLILSFAKSEMLDFQNKLLFDGRYCFIFIYFIFFQCAHSYCLIYILVNNFFFFSSNQFAYKFFYHCCLDIMKKKKFYWFSFLLYTLIFFLTDIVLQEGH